MSNSQARSTTGFNKDSAPFFPGRNRRTSSLPVVPRELRDEKIKTEESILDEIRLRMKRQDEPSKAFISEYDLSEIWSERTTFTTLFAAEPWSDEEIDTVRDQCVKVLSLLVWIRSAAVLPSFRDFFFCQGPRYVDSPLFTDENFLSMSYDDLECFGSDIAKRKAFLDERHCFDPVKIEEEESQNTKWIPAEARLPWAKVSKDIGMGGYGTVRKVTIPSGYLVQQKGSYATASTQDAEVACKLVERTEDFSKEVENLSILRESITTHANIIKHMGTMIHGSLYYILLPLAIGDLELLLNEGRDPLSLDMKENLDDSILDMVSNASTYDLITQSYLVADALKWLHQGLGVPDQPELYCIHSDLKPSNVLIMTDNTSQVGRWLLSDFGLSVIDTQTESQDTHVLTIGDAFAHLQSRGRPQRAAGTYQAPEVQPSRENRVGRKSDVWSLACIFSEVICFALGRNRLLTKFQTARTDEQEMNDYFYSPVDVKGNSLSVPGGESFDVRPSVVEWLRSLSELYIDECDEISCCVNVILRSLVVDYDSRPDVEQLRSDLLHVREHFTAPQGFKVGDCPFLLPSSPSSPAHISQESDTISSSSSQNLHVTKSANSSSTWSTRMAQIERPRSPSSPSLGSEESSRSGTESIGSTISPMISRTGTSENKSWIVESVDRLDIKDQGGISNRPSLGALSTHADKALWIFHSQLGTQARIFDTMPGVQFSQTSVLRIPGDIDVQAAAMAGSYVSILGRSKMSRSRKAAVVYHLEEPSKPVPIESNLLHPSMKWTMVSQHGIIILVHPNQILVARLCTSGTRRVIKEHSLGLPEAAKEHTFHCASLSPCGRTLTAWSYGNGPERFYSWKLVDSRRTWVLHSQMEYERVHAGSSYDVELLPEDFGQFCLIRAKSLSEFFVANATKPVRSHNRQPSNQTHFPHVQLVCMFEKHWIITLEEKSVLRRKTELKCRRILEENGHFAITSEGYTLCKLDGKVDPNSCTMRVYNQHGRAAVLICNNDGTVIKITLK